MTLFVEKGNEIKEIFEEDLPFFEYKGYRKTSKRPEVVTSEPAKKGRKKTVAEENKDED